MRQRRLRSIGLVTLLALMCTVVTSGVPSASGPRAAHADPGPPVTVPSGGAPPVACALTAADLAAQATSWRQLAAQALTERTETSYGLRLTFRTQPSVAEELRRLAAVENQCCPWATWTIEPGAQQTVLDVRSTGDGITTLHTMFTGLDPRHPAAEDASRMPGS